MQAEITDYLVMSMLIREMINKIESQIPVIVSVIWEAL
jgi:hypothetical protein